MAEDHPTPAEPPENGLARIGEVIRDRRKGRFTVKELASTSGVSIGVLSEIERGIGNPSYRTLHKIAQALDIRIGELVEGASEPRPRSAVVRSAERMRLQIGSEGLVYELLTPDLRGRLEMLQTRVPAGWNNLADPFGHDGEECVLILDGTLHVTLAGETHELADGDAITYDASQPHSWENRTQQEALIVGAVTPPSF
ncbi:MAG: XRE family transcriptional regulator [Acidimicrobiia bacterium]|nr:XRE family transcriptional regulator [Acidimicrobiia bacterium]